MGNPNINPNPNPKPDTDPNPNPTKPYYHNRNSTRKPCCHRELLRDAGHLYRKLASNPQATQWTETTLKLSANMGSCQKNDFASAYFYFRPSSPTELESVSHVSSFTLKIFTNYPLPSYSFLATDMLREHVALTSDL